MTKNTYFGFTKIQWWSLLSVKFSIELYKIEKNAWNIFNDKKLLQILLKLLHSFI